MNNKTRIKRLGRSGVAASVAIACLAAVGLGSSVSPVRGAVAETRASVAAREDFTIPSYLQKSAFVGEKVTVATVLPSEDKAENFRSYVLLDGEIIPTERNAFRPERSGIYTCVYEYSYAGQDYRYSYAVTVSVKDAPVFLDEPNFPAAFIAGKNYTLPVLRAADYSQNGLTAEASVSVTADGLAVPVQNGAITPAFTFPGCEVRIVYQAVINEKSATLEYRVPIVSVASEAGIDYAGLFLNRGFNSVSDTSSGVLLTTTGNASATFVNPVIAGGSELRFGFGARANAEGIRVTVFSDADPSVFFTLTYYKNGRATLNGKEECAFTLVDGDGFGLTYRASTGQLLDGAGNAIFTLTEDANGQPFAGFANGLMRVRFELVGTYATSDLVVTKIGSQVFSGITRDRLAPALYTESYGTLYALDEEIVIRGVRAVDSVDPNAKVTVSVFLGTEEVNGGTLQNNEFRFKAQKPGAYMFRFTTMDESGNTNMQTRRIQIFDDAAPVITVNGEPSAQVKKGASFQIPSVTATDDGTVTLQISVIYPSGRMYCLQRGAALEEQTYTFGEAGVYTFRILASDDSGNCTVQDFSVICEE